MSFDIVVCIFFGIVFAGLIIVMVLAVIAEDKIDMDKYAHTITTVNNKDFEIISLNIQTENSTHGFIFAGYGNIYGESKRYYTFFRKEEGEMIQTKIATDDITLFCTDKHSFYREETTTKVRKFNDETIFWYRLCDSKKHEETKKFIYISQDDMQKLN